MTSGLVVISWLALLETDVRRVHGLTPVSRTKQIDEIADSFNPEGGPAEHSSSAQSKASLKLLPDWDDVDPVILARVIDQPLEIQVGFGCPEHWQSGTSQEQLSDLSPVNMISQQPTPAGMQIQCPTQIHAHATMHPHCTHTDDDHSKGDHASDT